ncbi:MAG: TetR/AcrR family transcriptional regulator [Dysgonomonas sp.]|nr:TetR/AcrR family transcriptional regulator [Dysgonomonas sp.]
MNSRELNTEKVILEAAEAEFLEKGYGSSKMLAIAKRAGVSHSMLHYYYRSKENLFQTIFLKKIQVISSSLGGIFDQQLSFFETVRLIIEFQFDFVANNPKLPRFILNEIASNENNRALLLSLLAPQIKSISEKLENMLTKEIDRGSIRPITVYDLIMNIVSMNVSTFIAMPIVRDLFSLKDDKLVQDLLDKRRESNIQFVLNALRP